MPGGAENLRTRKLPPPPLPAVGGAVLTVLVVFAATLVVFLSANFLRHEPMASAIEVGFWIVVGDAALALPLIWLLRVTVAWDGRLRWPVYIMAGVVIAFLQSGWDTLVRLWLETIPWDADRMQAAFIGSTPLNIYHTGMVAAVLAFQAAFVGMRDRQQQLDLARESERSAHLAALRFQLNPHFLFNTMNALSSLVVTRRTEEAETMIGRLSAFLRGALAAEPSNLVRLDEEFEVLEAYLDIESVRFGNRLVTRIELPPELAGVRVPPFLLQPLVENAMKYAVAPTRRTVTVAISASSGEGQLHLTVSDDGHTPPTSAGTGLGLANVRQRLALEYGRAAALTTRSDARGFCASIALPLEPPPAA